MATSNSPEARLELPPSATLVNDQNPSKEAETDSETANVAGDAQDDESIYNTTMHLMRPVL